MVVDTGDRNEAGDDDGQGPARRNWLDGALNRVALPAVPVVEPWSLSLARLIGQRDVPAVARKALGLLDRFGAVRISPVSLGLDADDADWTAITGIQTAPLFDLVTSVALDREVARLRKLLPPVPGRKWVVNRALQGLRALLRKAARQDDADANQLGIVAVVNYKGRFGRPKELQPGVAAALILGTLPKLNQSILATADTHRVPIRPLAGTPGGHTRASRQQKAEELNAALEQINDGQDPDEKPPARK